MSFDGLQERLGALQNTISQVRDLIHRLTDAELQPPPPLVSTTATDEQGTEGGLGAEILQLLREAQDERRKLEEEVELLGGLDGHGKSRLQEGLDRTGTDLERCRVDFRLAKLSARKESAQAYRQERRLFVQSFALPNSSVDPTEHSPAVHAPAPLPTRHQIQKAQLSSLSEKDRQTVGASSRATEALRQMHASLQSELERSEYANQTMTESTATFNQLSESYNSLETMLGNSKDLLGSLLRSQKSDTWYLKTSLYLLAGSFAWLVFRRFLYGPLWWFAWLPLRFIFSVGSRVSRVALQGRGKGGEERPGAGGSSGTEGRVSVDGLPGEDLPTAQVGQDTGHNTDEPGSMAEKIGQIIDKVQEADEEGLIPEEPESEAEVIHNSPEMEEIRPRDEL